jgi:hypothetical protein
MDEQIHCLFISTLANRIVSASHDATTPLLSLSFATKVPSARLLGDVPDRVDLAELSKGVHYSVILSLFRELPIHYPNPIELFSLILTALRSLGFTPIQPCEPLNLANSALADHLNLCAAIEFLIVDRALNLHNLLDDLRRLPRSLFVVPEAPIHHYDTIINRLKKLHSHPDVY